jgi:hypothetical protein
MVQAASLFNQLLQHFPRTEFAALVRKHKAERAAKGFTCWTQFVAMLFCQLGHADSLREICNGLACCLGRLVYLGIFQAPRRSTLSYANEHRPAALFEELFFTALARFRQEQALGGRRHKFRFKNKLLSLDSTTISLCLSLFPWAKFRRAKGGVKAHVLLDHDDYLPASVLVTEAKRSDDYPPDQREDVCWHRTRQIEHLACDAYSRLLCDPVIREHFRTDAAIAAFWKLPDDQRRRFWGKPLDIARAPFVQEYDQWERAIA